MQSANDGTSLYVDLSSLGRTGSRFALLSSQGGAVGLVPPTTASGFSCYAVNVTGPGIIDSSPNPDADPMLRFYDTLNVPGTYCSYRGVVTPPLMLDSTGSTTAELQVPPGGVRLVQVVGVNDPLVCQSGVVDDPPGSTGGGQRFYEVGRAVLSDVFGDRSVDVNMNWPTTAAEQAARVMDCGGCKVDDHYATTTANTGVTFGTYPYYAQRVVTQPGSYIRRVVLPLSATTAGTAYSLKVVLYGEPNGGTPLSAPSASVSTVISAHYQTTVSYTFTTASVYEDVDLSLADAAGTALQMQSGYDYWIVVNAPSGVSWRTASATSDPGFAQAISSTWSAFSTGPSYSLGEYRLSVCGN